MRKLPIAAAVTLITLALGVGVALGVTDAKTKTKGKHGGAATTKGKHKHHRHKRTHKHHRHPKQHKRHTATGRHRRTHKRHTAAAHRTSAPVLRVSGTVLKWTRIKKIRRYELATIRHPATTRDTTYRIVEGTRFKLASTGGQTIKYSVRADVRHAHWSREVSVPVSQPRPPAPATVAPPTGAAAPVAPTVSAPAASQKLVVAVMNTTGWGVDSIFTKAGITATRLNIGEGDGINLLKTAISHGMRPLPLYAEGPDGNCTDLSPAQVGSDVAALAPELKALGITALEICNESYLSETDSAYAAQYNAAHAALAGTGIKALAVATALSANCGAGDATPNWIPDVVKDLPGGASEVDAWTIHPYGPISGTEACAANPNGYGWADVTDWHNIAVAAGSTAPWYITEVGQQLDGSDAVTQAQQAADVTTYLNAVKNMPWVAYIDFYSCRDDGTGQWGLLNSDNSPRPSFTALAAFMTANAASLNG